MKTEMSPKRKLNRFILRTAKIVRILSVAPVPAFILFAILCFKGEMAFPWEFITAVFSISFLPLLAYPLQPVIPAFRNKGREGQRTLAMIMSSLGYVIAVAVLSEMACVILPENIEMEEESLNKARSEGMTVLKSPLTAYEICGRIYAQGIPAQA